MEDPENLGSGMAGAGDSLVKQYPPATHQFLEVPVIDVGEARIQDRAYFGGIIDQMDSCGREALLHYLLEYDLAGTNLGSPPRTEALRDQKEHSASPVQNWWFERLMDGYTTSDETEWKPDMRTDTLYEAYCEVSKMVGIKTPGSFNGIWKRAKDAYSRVGKG